MEIMPGTEDIRGHYVKVNSTRTFYDEIGEGYPIVCVHTAGSCSLEYTYLLPLLAERGFHAYALDLPGHFRSYPVNWKPHRTIHEHAEFVRTFANTLGLKKPVIMGCSIGGDITLDYGRASLARDGRGHTDGGPVALADFSESHRANPSGLGAGLAGSAGAGGDRVAQSQLFGGKAFGASLAASRAASQRGR
jgi:pimeloyl-ACP methyl ester carboxylesterase